MNPMTMVRNFDFQRVAGRAAAFPGVVWLALALAGAGAHAGAAVPPKLEILDTVNQEHTQRSLRLRGEFSGNGTQWRLERRLFLSGGTSFACGEGAAGWVAPWSGDLSGSLFGGTGEVLATVAEMPLTPPSVAPVSGTGPRPSWTFVRSSMTRLNSGQVVIRWPSGGSASASAASVTAVLSSAQMNLTDPWGQGRAPMGVGVVTGPSSDPTPIFLSFCAFPDATATAPAASTLTGLDVTIRNFLLSHATEIRNQLFYKPNLGPPPPPTPVTPDRRSFFFLRTETAAALNQWGVPLGIAAAFFHSNPADDFLVISEMCVANVVPVGNSVGLAGSDAADWVEILNPGRNNIYAGDYRLTDKDDNTGWNPLPPVTLAPGQSLVMTCVKEGVPAGDHLEAWTAKFDLKEDFSETVHLGKVGAGGVVTEKHQLKAPAGAFPTHAPAGITYGIRSNAAGTGIEKGFFSVPTRDNHTQGALNQGWLSAGAVPEPLVEDAASPVTAPLPGYGRVFSSGNIAVRLRCADPSAVTTYTLNGSEPNGMSPVYTSGTTLTFAGTTVLRARAFRTGYLPSAVTTRTYIHAPSLFSQQWPRDQHRSVGAPLHDPQVWATYATSAPTLAGAPAPGGILAQLTALPSMFLTWHDGTPILQDGAKREIPMHAEYWDPAAPSTTYTAETAVLQDAGNHSEPNNGTPPYFPDNKLSWHLIFKKAFNLHGTSVFAGPVIPAGQANAGTSAIFPGSKVTSFHRLLLRNPGSDAWASGGLSNSRFDSHYFNDAYLKETQRALSGSTALVPRRRWIHVYVNGYYFGVYDLEEHIDEDMISSHLLAETPGVDPKKVEPEDILVFHSNGSESETTDASNA